MARYLYRCSCGNETILYVPAVEVLCPQHLRSKPMKLVEGTRSTQEASEAE